jgi:hypothetical protein
MCEFNSFTKACTLFLVWAATAIALPSASGRSGLDLWESNGTTTRFLASLT